MLLHHMNDLKAIPPIHFFLYYNRIIQFSRNITDHLLTI
ncbi:hypothetical protein UF75_3940 [Desulfosporosinus sp. I2]|nr:hypothetical protein UF75_3940 [Desulfosporosinus sp. I2]